ncbi:hypothetical protein [Mesorhizobium sp. 1B3]|uniref:hypothetical protein n=1 Tax=Mesorhizobium sp. 1B3 TaxID=3243599 RepID=UPI003D973C60
MNRAISGGLQRLLLKDETLGRQMRRVFMSVRQWLGARIEKTAAGFLFFSALVVAYPVAAEENYNEAQTVDFIISNLNRIARTESLSYYFRPKYSFEYSKPYFVVHIYHTRADEHGDPLEYEMNHSILEYLLYVVDLRHDYEVPGGIVNGEANNYLQITCYTECVEVLERTYSADNKILEQSKFFFEWHHDFSGDIHGWQQRNC